MLGQRLTRQLADGGPMIYWATLEPRDTEDRAIVRRHLAERDGWGFGTLERGRALPEGLALVPREGAVLWVLLALSVGLPLWLDGSFGPRAAAVGYGLAVWYGFRNLDGMSGDISGFALTLGELCGCGAAILWR